MFFSRPKHLINPSIRFQRKYPHGFLGQNHCLCNGLILHLYNPNQEKTILELINPKNNHLVASQTLEGIYHLIVHFKNDHVLLANLNTEEKLLLHGGTLNQIRTISHPFSGHEKQVALSNYQFISVETIKGKYRLMLHDLEKASQIASEFFSLNDMDNVACGLIAISNNQLAFKVIRNGSGVVEVCLMNKANQRDDFFELTITITMYPAPHEERAPGNFLGLPNGQILTFSTSGVNFNVWRATVTVQQWRWPEFYNGHLQIRQVVSLPDNKHIVVLVCYTKVMNKLFLFELKTQTIKSFNLNCQPEQVTVCPNGQLLIQATQFDVSAGRNRILLCVDFNESISWRNEEKKVLKDRLAVAHQLALSCPTLPVEIIEYIMSYVFHEPLRCPWLAEEEEDRGCCLIL